MTERLNSNPPKNCGEGDLPVEAKKIFFLQSIL